MTSATNGRAALRRKPLTTLRKTASIIYLKGITKTIDNKKCGNTFNCYTQMERLWTDGHLPAGFLHCRHVREQSHRGIHTSVPVLSVRTITSTGQSVHCPRSQDLARSPQFKPKDDEHPWQGAENPFPLFHATVLLFGQF